VGASFEQADEDNARFFVFDDNTQERIINYVGTTSVETLCASGSATKTCTAGYVRGGMKASYYHRSQNKIVVMFDVYVYITSPITISYTRVFNLSGEDPTATATQIDEFKQFVFLFNANGIFKIDLTATVPLMYKINGNCPGVRIVDQNITTQGVIDTTKPYGRKYIYKMSRITGVTGLRDRTTSNAVVEQESGPVLASAVAAYKDFGTAYGARPIGNGSTFYGVLTGGALGGSYDTASEWAVLGNNCQFTITVNGSAKSVTCDFTDVLTMDDVATRIQIGMRSIFTTTSYASTVLCDYVTDHFVITSPDESGTVTVTTAGASGTDIGTAAMSCQSGTGTVTTPAYATARTIGTLRIPFDASGGVEKHWTHFSVYSTLEIGKYGYDPVNGLANNKENYIWLYDIHVGRAVTAAVTVTSGLITLNSGELFTQKDVGGGLLLEDGTTDTIQYLCDSGGTRVYTETSRYAIGDTVTAKTAQSCCFSGARVITATQAVSGTETTGASTITYVTGGPASNFVAADINRTISCEDGSEQHIVRVIDSTHVEVAESATKTSKAFTIAETYRLISDDVPDETLRYRASKKEFLLQNRLWEPLPACNKGVISSGFMFTAITTGRDINYSQMPETLEYMVGYQNPDYQIVSAKDLIVDLVRYPDLVAVFCKNSTYEIPTNTFSTQKIEQVGIVVAIISGLVMVSDSIGAWAVKRTYRGETIVITPEPAIRIFSGRTYSENLIESKMMTKFKGYANTFTISFDPINGLNFWALE